MEGFKLTRERNEKQAGKTKLFSQLACRDEEGEHGKEQMMGSGALFFYVFFGKNSNCCQLLAGDRTSETPEMRGNKAHTEIGFAAILFVLV